jgi:hypothetical protein
MRPIVNRCQRHVSTKDGTKRLIGWNDVLFVVPLNHFAIKRKLIFRANQIAWQELKNIVA